MEALEECDLATARFGGGGGIFAHYKLNILARAGGQQEADDSLGRLGVVTDTPSYLTASLACLAHPRPLVLTDQRREEEPMAVVAEHDSMPVQQEHGLPCRRKSIFIREGSGQCRDSSSSSPPSPMDTGQSEMDDHRAAINVRVKELAATGHLVRLW
jgi:hypothetical protein